MICVARKARRASSKLWHGRKDDEYLGFWDTFVPSAFWASAARNLRSDGTLQDLDGIRVLDSEG
jgi:hypothetical protein